MRRIIPLLLLFFIALSNLQAQCPQYDFSHLTAGFTLDCQRNPITVQAVLAGDPPQTFLWTMNGNVLGDELTFVFDDPGVYNLIITGNDGCLQNVPFAVNIVEVALSIDAVVTQPVCTDDGTGSISLITESPNQPVTYVWSDGSTEEDRFNLPAGEYSVTATDSEGCQIDTSILIAPTFNGSIFLESLGAASCSPGGDGHIFLVLDDFEDPYSIIWSNGWDTEINEGLDAGEYSVTVTDANGCSVEASYTVGNEIDVVIDYSDGGTINCESSQVSLYANPGNENLYNYIWTGPNVAGQTSATVTVDEPGTYGVLVSSIANPGCSSFGTFTVEEYLEPVNVSYEVIDGGCGELGTIIGEVTSGEYPMTVQWRQSGNLLLQQTLTDPSFTFNQVQPGVYELIVSSNVSHCRSVDTLVVSLDGGVNATIEIESMSCDDQTVTLNAIAENGAPPYSYLWSNGATTERIENVPAGTYTVLVRDTEECTSTGFIDAGTPDITVEYVFFPASCDGSDGRIEINPTSTSGGTFTYEWSTGATTQHLTDVPAGTYDVTITYGDGCTYTAGYDLPSVLDVDLQISGSVLIDDACNQRLFVLTASPILPGLTYRWFNPDGDHIATANTITVSENGTYTVTASNGQGCTGSATFQVEEALGLQTYINSFPNQCSNTTTLSLTFNPEIDRDSLTSEWALPNGTRVFTDNHELIITETGWYTYFGTYENEECVISLTDSIFLDIIGAPCEGVNGRLWADEGNCMLDNTEIPVANWLIRFETALGAFAGYALTNSAGTFNTSLPTGNYIAKPAAWNTDLYGVCPDVHAFYVDQNGNGYVDIFMPYEEACPAMYVNVSATRLLRCFENEVHVYYCNDGPVVAENAQVTVELDPFLTFISASVEPVISDIRSVTFDLGDLDPFECGYISMTVLASCEAEIGQTHCIEATASPNTPCPTPNNWNGANLSLEASCDGDSLTFLITNDGIGPLTEPLRYIVIEDGIMMMSSPVTGPILNPGETLEVNVAANGSTYHFETTQEDGNPGFTTPTMVVEGCGVNGQGTFTTGLVNLLPLGDASTNWYDILCRDNTGSYDPNDKRGFPIGVDEPHYIAKGTSIEYDIRFQNTGTDTAFTVVIRDTIAPTFDLNTLRMGASSHDYSYEIDENRTLTITFNNIMLPDSNVNLAASQGIVSYTIDHVADLPLGTELENQAAIYFDFNEPIFTETTLHTLGEDFISFLIPTGESSKLPMTIFPNPADRNAAINVNIPVENGYQLEIYDGLGRLVKTHKSNTGRTSIDMSQFPSGFYVARALNHEGRFLSLKRFLLE